MPLTAGLRIGPYEVIGPLGAGGMGEVFRARDTRLGRDVAIKVLRAGMTGDPERRARFDREARLLASLSHPHIAAVLGLEEVDGAPALVMELIEGPTLAERISRGGPLPAHEAFPIARRIAEALEYAHERGVIHRDLKPANIKLPPDGGVKVLDFGLAKAVLGDAAASGSEVSQLTQSPTVTLGTHAGVLLGTAAYMAPEQARGRTVDKRADIWAFGAVLYEMLVGRQLFAGETVSDTLAAILAGSPDWTALPARTPVRVRELLRRCLDKDPKQRLRDIGDARLELDAVIAAGDSAASLAGEAAAPDLRARRLAMWGVPVLALLALATGYALRGALAPADRPVTRVSIVPPAELRMRGMWFTRDGREVFARGVSVEAATGRQVSRIYHRRLDRFAWEPVPGTDGVVAYDFSADGKWLYFVAPVAAGSRQNHLSRVPIEGRVLPVTVMPWPDDFGSWDLLPDGRVVVRRRGAAVFTVVTPGSRTAPVWKELRADHPVSNFDIHDTIGPDQVAGVLGYYASGTWNLDAAVLSTETGRIDILEPNTGSPRLYPSGIMLLTRGRALLAARYDAKGRRLTTKPVALFDGLRVGNEWEHSAIHISPSGDLVYAPGASSATGRSLVVVGEGGRSTPWNGERGPFELPPAVSPDGRALLVSATPPGLSIYELLRLDRNRPGTRRFAAFEGEDCTQPRFSPDGRRVAYLRQGVDSTAGLYVASLEAPESPRLLLRARNVHDFDVPACWTPDGRSLVVSTGRGARRSIRILPADAPEPEVRDLLAPRHNVHGPQISPDGSRIAFISDESGSNQVQVATFTGGRIGTPVAVSRTGGIMPKWLPDGRTLVYVTPLRVLMRCRVSESLEVSPPEPWMDLSDRIQDLEDWDLAPDGSVVILQRGENEGDVKQFDLVLGFEREARAALARARRDAP